MYAFPLLLCGTQHLSNRTTSMCEISLSICFNFGLFRLPHCLTRLLAHIHVCYMIRLNKWYCCLISNLLFSFAWLPAFNLGGCSISVVNGRTLFIYICDATGCYLCLFIFLSMHDLYWNGKSVTRIAIHSGIHTECCHISWEAIALTLGSCHAFLVPQSR